VTPAVPVPAARSVVYVVGGAGGHQTVARNINQAVAEKCLPISVQPFLWTHPGGVGLSDLVDQDYRMAQGRRLAQTVLCHRQCYPQQPITVVAHSAGCGVVTAAAECLPPDCVERILLLAPSISECADIRPALRAARLGVDTYVSDNDRLYLGFGVALLGSSDGVRAPAAGRTGFLPRVDCPEEATLYTRLRQHPWDPAMAVTGHNGGHSGTYQPVYLRTFILPLLVPGPTSP
jgi:pimeloyl-ACP methyl ester carboxylesterase